MIPLIAAEMLGRVASSLTGGSDAPRQGFAVPVRPAASWQGAHLPHGLVLPGPGPAQPGVGGAVVPAGSTGR